MLDIIIENGLVFNSETGFFEQKSIGIEDGMFSETSLGDEAKQKINATGKYIIPGLIDEHAHWNLQGSIIGANADLMCIPSGVTTTCDGGTCGASGFELFYQSNIIRCETTVYSYLNISTFGNKSLCIHEENHDPADFREDLIEKCFHRHGDILRGLKVRMCKATLENYGMAPLHAAKKISCKLKKMGYHCPVIVHYDNLPESVSVNELFDVLEKGDVVAHIFQTKGETIFTEEREIKESVLAAQKRGVYLDDCHGRVHWSFANLQNAFSKGFYPDVISSDLVRASEYMRPGFSLLYAMSVESAAGMPVERILQCVTANPAHILGIQDQAGNIRPGRPADIVILDIQDTEMKFTDSYGVKVPGNKIFVPLMTIKGGRIAYRQIFF